MIYKELNEVIVGGSSINIATSHELCIIEDNNQLSSLIAKGDTPDKTNCYKLIELFVIEIFEWFGKDAKIELIQSIAKTIYNNYYWLKLSELKLFVEKIKGGTWKQVHGMSPAVIMERLADFVDESMEIRELIFNLNTKKEIENNLLISDEQKKEFSEFASYLAGKSKTQQSIKKQEMSNKIHENAEKIKKYLKDKEQNWNELMEKVENKEITELEAVSEHNKYCLEYK